MQSQRYKSRRNGPKLRIRAEAKAGQAREMQTDADKHQAAPPVSSGYAVAPTLHKLTILNFDEVTLLALGPLFEKKSLVKQA